MWHTIPAQTVQELLTLRFQQFPPTSEQLQRLLLEYDYSIVPVPQRYMKTPVTDHWERLVYLPYPYEPEMLLHEVAEMLLRLPVAPEFRFQPSWRDDFHEVARLVEGYAK